MKILLTGGTGLIGNAVLRQLVHRGHAVTAVVRSASSARAVEGDGATPLEGDLTDSTWLADQLRAHDAAVHTASPGDATSSDFDSAVVDAVLDAFGTTTKPYVHTGGVWVHGSGEGLTEDTPFAPPALTAWRVDVERRLLDADLVATVVEPGVVHAEGQGIPQLLVDGPRDDAGALQLIGGDQHWSLVHADDLAELYALVVESGERHERVLGVSGENPTVRAIGEAVSDDVVVTSAEQVHERLGEPFGDALLLDQQADGSKARGLGWQPTRPTLLEALSSRR